MSAAIDLHTDNDAYLTVYVGGDPVAVQLHHLTEIVEMQAVAKVPGAPEWIHGVFNLRGRVLPVIDMAKRLALPTQPLTPRACFLVMDVDLDGLVVPMALLVESVGQVVDVVSSEIEPPPMFGTRIAGNYLKGAYLGGGDVLLLVDPIKVFMQEELLEAARLEHQERKRLAEEAAARAEAANDNDAESASGAGGGDVAPDEDTYGKEADDCPGLFLF